MCCARIVNGIGTGHLNAIVPVWSAEVASHTSRGAFIASEFTLNIFGVVAAYWLEFGLGFVGDGTSQVRWRVCNSNHVANATTTASYHNFAFIVPDRLPDSAGARVYGTSPLDWVLSLTYAKLTLISL